MTEEEWLRTNDARRMLQFIEAWATGTLPAPRTGLSARRRTVPRTVPERPGRAVPRLLYLSFCGFKRYILDFLIRTKPAHPFVGNLLREGEFADGRLTLEEL